MAKTEKKIKLEYGIFDQLRYWIPVYRNTENGTLVVDSNEFVSQEDAIKHAKNSQHELLGFKSRSMGVIKKGNKNGKTKN
jgi:hypothetical protein